MRASLHTRPEFLRLWNLVFIKALVQMFTIKGFVTSGLLKLIDKSRANKDNNDSNLRHVAAPCVALSRNKVSLCLQFSRRSLHAVCDKQRQVEIESTERPALSGSIIYRGMAETIPKI